MVNLVSLTFDVKVERSCLSLDVTAEVVVVRELILGFELDLDWQI
jgi:hypothetical protein